MADETDTLFLQEEAPRDKLSGEPTGYHCTFCDGTINRDDPDNYREVTSWVHGPKLDGPVLREQTGRMAHKTCIEKVINGQAPDQEELF